MNTNHAKVDRSVGVQVSACPAQCVRKPTLELLRLLACLSLLAGFVSTRPALAQSTVDSVITTNLFDPHSVAVKDDSTIFVTDSSNHRIVKFDTTTGAFTVLAGVAGVSGASNGTGSAARFNQPQGIVIARDGLVVADSANQLIRFVSFSGVVSNLAGVPGLTGSDNGAGSVARFRYPSGLATDSDGNIFIADSKNDSIRKLDRNNNVTTVASGFYEPAGVVLGNNGDLYVADTRRHVIKRVDTNGVITIVAGVTGVSGFNDDALATQSAFNSPRGLLWLGTGIGLLISDSGNHTVRRLYYNPDLGANSMETFAGTPGQAGLLNGPALSAQFNSPIGLARDSLGSGFFVVDRANNHVRRIATSPPLPPVTDPVIGWVEIVKDVFGDYVTHLNKVTSSVFNNEVTIAILSEAGTQTYFTSGPTPPSSFEDTIPAPGPQAGLTPPEYRNGRPPSETPATLLPPQPDLTIKAVGTQDGRRSSSAVKARFQFKAGNPAVIGDNSASFKLDDITRGAELWYTIDGSEPTNTTAGGSTSLGPKSAGDILSFSIESDLTFKVRAFKASFKPSDVITKIFSPTNFIPNTISFGFQNGEASSDFVGSAGQTFYAPVTLGLLPNVKLYSLQFNLSVTNLATAPPVTPGALGFETRLVKPIPGTQPPVFQRIPPSMFVGYSLSSIIIGGSNFFVTNLVFTNLVVTNKNLNLLAVGWLERFGFTNLYDTVAQDLIKYSLPHDNLFLGDQGKVVPGAFLFKIPETAATGQVYRIQIGRPTATADGVNEGVYLTAPTNGSLVAGSINAVKHVTVGQRRYLVGDVDQFRWYNAGDFGDGLLGNADALQVFQSAIYKLNMPPNQGNPNSPIPDSDFFDAMDSSNGRTNGLLNAATDDNSVIDTIQYGDRVLAVDDVFVTFRRGLDPTLKWYARYWANGTRLAEEVPNVFPRSVAPPPPQPPPDPVDSTQSASVKLVVADIKANGSRTVQIPIRADIRGGLPLRVAMMNLRVVPLDNSPALTQSISFDASSGLGAATLSSSTSPQDFAAAWLNSSVPGISGSTLLGTLNVTLPASAGPNAAYRVQFDHLSASPNGVSLFAAQTESGLLTDSDRSASSWNDGIPDWWRLKHFGTLNNILSSAQADADGDGVLNLAEFAAGTNPNDAQSALKLLAAQTALNHAFKVSWPTVANKHYVLEGSSTLDSDNWSVLATNILGDGNLKEFIEASTASPIRFYRVRAE